MGKYILCRQKLAETPFHIESVHLNIYSIEELCWFLSSNPALSFDVVRNKELSGWLAEQCGMGDKIKEYNLIKEEDKISGRLSWIYTQSRYFTESELRIAISRAENIDSMSPIRKQMARGDELVKYGKYEKGIQCYEQLLATEGIESEKGALKARVYYNMGVACEKMFLSGKAMDYFYKAYKCGDSAEYLTHYLKAAYFDGGKEELYSEAKKTGAKNSLVSLILREIDNIEPYEMPSDADKAIDGWVRDYYSSVDQ